MSQKFQLYVLVYTIINKIDLVVANEHFLPIVLLDPRLKLSKNETFFTLQGIFNYRIVCECTTVPVKLIYLY